MGGQFELPHSMPPPPRCRAIGPRRVFLSLCPVPMCDMAPWCSETFSHSRKLTQQVFRTEGPGRGGSGCCGLNEVLTLDPTGRGTGDGGVSRAGAVGSPAAEAAGLSPSLDVPSAWLGLPRDSGAWSGRVPLPSCPRVGARLGEAAVHVQACVLAEPGPGGGGRGSEPVCAGQEQDVWTFKACSDPLPPPGPPAGSLCVVSLVVPSS